MHWWTTYALQGMLRIDDDDDDHHHYLMMMMMQAIPRGSNGSSVADMLV